MAFLGFTENVESIYNYSLGIICLIRRIINSPGPESD